MTFTASDLGTLEKLTLTTFTGSYVGNLEKLTLTTFTSADNSILEETDTNDLTFTASPHPLQHRNCAAGRAIFPRTRTSATSSLPA